MDKFSEPGHAVTVEVAVDAYQAFDFMSDPLQLGKWAFGCMDSEKTGSQDVYTGVSIFNGEKSLYSISSNRELLLIDYMLGLPGAFKPRISARIVAADTYGAKDGHCLVTLLAWRATTMDDERWHQLCVCHETEALLVKSLLENANTEVN